MISPTQERRKTSPTPRVKEDLSYPRNGGRPLPLQERRNISPTPRVEEGLCYPRRGGRSLLPQEWRKISPTPRAKHPPCSQEARKPLRALLSLKDTSWHVAMVGWG